MPRGVSTHRTEKWTPPSAIKRPLANQTRTRVVLHTQHTIPKNVTIRSIILPLKKNTASFHLRLLSLDCALRTTPRPLRRSTTALLTITESIGRKQPSHMLNHASLITRSPLRLRQGQQHHTGSGTPAIQPSIVPCPITAASRLTKKYTTHGRSALVCRERSQRKPTRVNDVYDTTYTATFCFWTNMSQQ